MAELTPPAIPEWELWACAQETIRQHGEKAPAFAAARVEALDAEGADKGAATWRLILLRIQHLQEKPTGNLQ